MRLGVRVGVDVGAVRVGVASCDPAGMLATPRETVRRDGSGSDVERIVALVRQLEAIEVVVGLPRSLSGAEGPAARHARDYAQVLCARVSPLPVRLIDERLTSVDAHRALRTSGRPSRRHREVVDQVAAVLILQAALDLERARGDAPGEPVRSTVARPAQESI